MKTFRNYTDLSDVWLRQVYAAVCPPGLSAHDVAIKNCAGAFRGMAYTHGSGYHSSARPFVVVSVARTDRQAQVNMTRRHRPGYLPMAIGNRREAIVMILAHELRHLWQATHARGRVYGSRGRMSERDADAYALRMLRRYRRGELGV